MRRSPAGWRRRRGLGFGRGVHSFGLAAGQPPVLGNLDQPRLLELAEVL
jgi:hypothetical protein